MKMRLSFLLLFVSPLYFTSTLTAENQSSEYINIRDTSELKKNIELTLSDIKETKSLNQDRVYSLLKTSLILKDTASFFHLCNGTDKNYYRKNNLDQEAILFLKESQRIIETEETKYGDLNNSIGNYYQRINLALESLDYHFKSVEWFKKHESHNTTIPLGNIAQIYFLNEEFEKALEYNELALNYSLKLKDRDSKLYNIIYDYYRLGQIYNKLQNINKAEAYFEKSLLAAREYKHDNVTIIALIQAIKFYSKNGNTKHCKDLLKEGNALLKTKSTINPNLAEEYLLTKNQHYLTLDSDKAINPEVIQFKNSSLRNDVLAYSIKYYTQKKDISNIVKSYEELLEDNRKIDRESKRYIISNIEERYANRALEEMNKDLANTIKTRKSITISILAFLFVVTCLFILQLFNNRKHKKLNTLLKSKTEEQVILNEKLENSNQELERFAYIASHDLKTPVLNILNFTNLLEKQLDKNKDEKIHTYLSFIKEGGERMSSLIKNTLEYSRISDSKNTNQNEIIDLNLLINELESSISSFINRKNANISILNSLPSLKAHKHSMLLLFQNLIENGIVYNKTEVPTIKIYTKENEEFTTIYIEDNGIGVSKNNQEKIFTMYTRLHNHKNYKGSGLGLSICRKIIKEVDGEIQLKSTTELGSTFEIRLPHSIIV